MILLIGAKADPHIQAVSAEIDRLGAQCTIFDLFDNAGIGVQSQISRRARFAIGDAQLDLSSVEAVWWRLKPIGAVPTDSLLAYYDCQFRHREWNYLCNFLASETAQAFSINDRRCAAIADDKLLQLRIAEDVGFAVPRTLISNIPDQILDFMSEFKDGPCIFKTLTPYMPPTGQIAFTSVVTRDDIQDNASGIAIAPGIYQELVQRQFELRITVVGEEVFVARITLPPDSDVDWRRQIFNEEIYDEYEISSEFRRRLLQLNAKLGLFFSAYDFIVDSQGTPIFLEANPAGQWLWLERILKYPVSATIASALVAAVEPGLARERASGC